MSRRADIHKCLECGNDYLEGYPHHHEKPLRPGYDPMPARPASVDAMLAIVRREWRLELNDRLHVQSVPPQLVDMPLNIGGKPAANGPTIAVRDTGPLGSPSWSPAFHRRVGAVTYWEGEQTIEEGDWGIYPWAFAIERRMDRWCRGRHGNRPDLWREHRGEPICRPLLELLVKHDYSIDMAALEFEMTPERARLVLDEALRRVWGQVSNMLNRLPFAA